MVDVFISYSRSNKDRVSQIAKGIEEAGYEVWWDAELPPHQSYGDVITAKIQMAKAAVVVWSAEAAASEWVRAEADVARNQKKLVQTALGDITPPLPFNQIQYANLGDWHGDQDHPEWRKVKASLTDLCGPRPPKAAEPSHAFPAGAPPATAASAPVAPSPPKPPQAAAPTAQPAPEPAPAPAPVASLAAESAPARSNGVPVPVVIGGLVALLGLAGAAWWVSTTGAEETPVALASAAPIDAAAADDAEVPAAPAPTPTPTVTQTVAAAPAPADAPRQQQQQPQRQQYNRDVRLINQTGETIMYLRWSVSTDSDYGADRLGADVLASGASWDVTIDDGTDACVYDLMASTASGRNIARNGVNVCSVSSVVFN